MDFLKEYVFVIFEIIHLSRFQILDHSHLPEPSNFEQIPNSAIEVVNNITETKVGPVVETIGQELQPSSVSENLSRVKKEKTLEERTSPASVGCANTVVANKNENKKQAVVHEITVTETVVGNVEKCSSLGEDNNQSSFVRNNEGDETRIVAVHYAGQNTSEDVIPSNEPDFSCGNDNINSVFNSDDLEKISSSGTVTNFSEEKEKQVAMEETEIPVKKATGSESQPPATVVSENTSMAQWKTGEEVMSKPGIVNEPNDYDAGQTMNSGAEKTSLPVTAVGNELKKIHVVETIITKTKAERVQHFPECSEIFPKHRVPTKTAESYQLSEESNSKRLVPSEELLPNVKINSEYPLQEEGVSGNTSGKSSNTVKIKHGQAGTLTKNLDPPEDEVETPILKSEIPVSQRLNEVFDQLDKFVTNSPTENTGDEQLAQQSTGAVNDANAKAGNVAGKDLKAELPKNVGKSATQGGRRGNSNNYKVRQLIVQRYIEKLVLCLYGVIKHLGNKYSKSL